MLFTVSCHVEGAYVSEAVDCLLTTGLGLMILVPGLSWTRDDFASRTRLYCEVGGLAGGSTETTCLLLAGYESAAGGEGPADDS